MDDGFKGVQIFVGGSTFFRGLGLGLFDRGVYGSFAFPDIGKIRGFMELTVISFFIVWHGCVNGDLTYVSIVGAPQGFGTKWDSFYDIFAGLGFQSGLTILFGDYGLVGASRG